MIKRTINIIRRLRILCRSALTEIFRTPVIVNGSVTIGYDGKPIHCNWGDDINYWFLREISRQPIIIYSQSVFNRLLRRNHMLGIGSIIGMASNHRSIIWGSGFLDSAIITIEPPAEIRAVRGPLTRQKLIEMGIDCPEVYGDPALLISKWYKPEIAKKHKIGVISQYSQRQQNDARKFLGQYDDIYFINIAEYNHWHDFVDNVLSCEIIASSSLHGLIIAEAYNIPSVWIELPTNEYGHRIKYHDFYASIGKECQPLIIDESFNIDILFQRCSEWTPGHIDLQPLIDSAPFNLKLKL